MKLRFLMSLKADYHLWKSSRMATKAEKLMNQVEKYEAWSKDALKESRYHLEVAKQLIRKMKE